MPNTILDYLDWRGDLRFDVAPFNEVDNYIISKIGCPDYTGIVPDNRKTLSLGEALERCFSSREAGGYPSTAFASPNLLPILKMLPETVRFRDLLLSGYVKHVDADVSEQFSALTVELPDGVHYVSFRGTDETMTGWKEDLMMAAMDSVPAQKDAVRYLSWASEVYDGEFIVGGHSKGGNLAVYAASNVSESVQNRIRRVYCNDGPGFFSSFYSTPGFRAIFPKLTALTPQRSIVGSFLDNPACMEVVRCDKGFLASHDGFNWEVRGTAFVRAPSFSRSSEVLDSALDTVIEQMTVEERAAFINEFFDILTSAGANSLTDFNEIGFRQAVEIAKNMKNNPAVSRFVSQILSQTARNLYK